MWNLRNLLQFKKYLITAFEILVNKQKFDFSHNLNFQ